MARACGPFPHVRDPGRLKLLLPLALVLGSAQLASADRASDRARAEQLLNTLAAAKDKTLADPLRRSQEALQRADDARGSGDFEHSAMLEGVAREWAESADALKRSSQVEQDAAQAQIRAGKLEARLRRARTLLEETLARRDRALAKLQKLDPKAAARASAGANEAVTAAGTEGEPSAAPKAAVPKAAPKTAAPKATKAPATTGGNKP